MPFRMMKDYLFGTDDDSNSNDGSSQPPSKRARCRISNNTSSGVEDGIITRGDRRMLNSVQTEGCTLRMATIAQRSNRTIVLAAVANDGKALMFASELLQADRDVVLAAVQSSGNALEFASLSLQNDREIVMTALQNTDDARILQFVSRQLRGDKDVVTMALTKPWASGGRGDPLAFVTNETLLHADLDVAKRGVTLRGQMIRLLPEALRSNREIALSAVASDGMVLKYVNTHLQNDEDVVMKAVSCNGEALRFASSSMRANRKVVLAAVTNSCDAIELVSRDLPIKCDREIALACVRHKGQRDMTRTLYKFDEKFLNDREIILAAMKNGGYALRMASADLRADPEVVACAISNCVRAFADADYLMRSKKEIALLAMQKDIYALRHVGDPLRNDPDIISVAANVLVKQSKFDNDFRRMDEDSFTFANMVGPNLRHRLKLMHSVLIQEENLPNEDEFTDFAETTWRRPSLEKIWLLRNIINGFHALEGPIERMIIEYAGYDRKIRQAKELTKLSNLYCKCADAGWAWDEIQWHGRR